MFLQALKVVASEVMVGNTCKLSLIVINNTINKIETNIIILIIFIACCCLQTCNVAASEEIVGERCVTSQSLKYH